MPPTEHNLRKSAILIASLDAASAAALVDKMSPEQARRVQAAVESLEDVAPEERAQVVDEFVRMGNMALRSVAPGIELDASLAARLAGSRPSSTSSITAPTVPNTTDAPSPLHFLQQTESELLAPCLEQERPQTIAIVLAHLSPARAADLLERFAPHLQAEIIQRLVDLDQADDEVLRELGTELETLVKDRIDSKQRRSHGLAAAARILLAVNDTGRQQVMSAIAQSNQELAGRLNRTEELPPLTDADAGYQRTAVTTHKPAEVREKSHEDFATEPETPKSRAPITMSQPDPDAQLQPRAVSTPKINQRSRPEDGLPLIDFDDVTQLDDQALQMVLKEADPRIAQLALIGANQQLVRRILGLLPRQLARRVRKQLDNVTPTRLTDVEAAQMEIAFLANQLAARGDITVANWKRFAVAA